ncbi:MAG: helix-turn-helix transcriptional regulator, partial [Clostridiales bacterium]|nr:helix-turn-helix transcriptional regulator [Clostridiales bacterium]
MLGSVIKYERLKQNMKQEVLCKNICSVSYMSKIESDTALPSEEITVLLFRKLGIQYQKDLP